MLSNRAASSFRKMHWRRASTFSRRRAVEQAATSFAPAAGLDRRQHFASKEPSRIVLQDRGDVSLVDAAGVQHRNEVGEDISVVRRPLPLDTQLLNPPEFAGAELARKFAEPAAVPVLDPHA